MTRAFLGASVFDGPVSGPQVAKNVTGLAAERLVASVIGARLWDGALPPFYVPRAVATESDDSPYALVPDAWWPKHSALVEVKAGIARFYTTERQWKSYRWARDTPVTALPVRRPRVFYAFVGYKLTKRSDRYPGAHALVNDMLQSIRYIVVADSRLVERFIAESGSYRTDHVGPLSPMLGIWHAHWNIRAHRLQAWADAPRATLDARGLTRWRVGPLRPTLRTAAERLAGEGWSVGGLGDIPAVVLAPCRRPRPAPDSLLGEQAVLFANEVACEACGFWAPVGICPACGDVNAF